MSGPPTLDLAARAAIRERLQDEAWQLTSVRKLAAEVGCNAAIVVEVRLEMGLEASPVAARRQHLRRLLDEPGSSAVTTRELAARTGLNPATVAKLRKRGVRADVRPPARAGSTQVRLVKPIAKVKTATIRGLEEQHLAMLRQLFERALRGADVQRLVLSDIGRDVHRAVIAAATKPGAA